MASTRNDLVVLAREARGHTQQRLAKLVGVSQSKISKIEAGVEPMDDDMVRRLAAALQLPAEFFSRAERVHHGGACFRYRKRKAIGARHLAQIEAAVGIQSLRIDSLLKSIDLKPTYEFPRLDVGKDGDFETPHDAALRVRALWGLPQGPVPNVTAAVESAGAFVIHCDFATPLVDAMSQWVPPRPPLLFVNALSMSGDRLRWTLAHELGHLVMHHRPSADEEADADEFASEFLMPAALIARQLRSVTFETLAALKYHWRVSMAALIVRAHRLGAIDDERYRSLNVELSWRGWKRQEPNPIPIERATFLERVLKFHTEQLNYSKEDLCRLVTALPEEFDTVFGFEAPSRAGRPSFRVVD